MKTKGRLRRAISILLICALITTVIKGPLFLTFATSREMKMDIGVDGDNVTAVLTSDGHLTISGHGETLDYTEETVPFADYVGKITSLEIKAGVTSIGDYLLYNCGNLSGELVLPGTLVRIGDYAFSGDSKEDAPKFHDIVNKFTKAEVVTPLDEELDGLGEGLEGETTEAVESPEGGEGLTGGEHAAGDGAEGENSAGETEAGEEDKKGQSGSQSGGQNAGQTGGNADGNQSGSGTSDSKPNTNTEEKPTNGNHGNAAETQPSDSTNATGDQNKESHSDNGGNESQDNGNQSNDGQGSDQNVGDNSQSGSSQTDAPASEAPASDAHVPEASAGDSQSGGNSGNGSDGASDQPAEDNQQVPDNIQIFGYQTTDIAPILMQGTAMVRRSARDHVWVTSKLSDGVESHDSQGSNTAQGGGSSTSKETNSSQTSGGTSKPGSGTANTGGNNSSGSTGTGNSGTASNTTEKIDGGTKADTTDTTGSTNNTHTTDNGNNAANGNDTTNGNGSTNGNTSTNPNNSTNANNADTSASSGANNGVDGETSLEGMEDTTDANGESATEEGLQGSEGLDGSEGLQDSEGMQDSESLQGGGAGAGDGLSGNGAGDGLSGNGAGPDESLPEELSTEETEETEEYLVETITEQEIGEEIFYIGQNGIYQCSEENITFIEATEAAGYKRVERMVKVSLDDVSMTLPITEGALTAPECPSELTSPDASGISLFSQTFAGWTLEEDWQNDGADAMDIQVYEPGDFIPIDEEWDTVALHSSWEETCSVIPEVRADLADTSVIYSVIDANTGEPIPDGTGDTVTYQWQVLRGAGAIASPSDAEEASWTTIDGATEADYERIPVKEDESAYFRAHVYIEKKTRTRASSETVEICSEGAAGLYTEQPITVIYAPGDGAEGTAPEAIRIASGGEFTPSANPFTHQGGLTFAGWNITYSGVIGVQSEESEVPEGTELLPGAAITLTSTGTETEPRVTLTAQWKQAEVLYVNQTSGSDENPGTMEQPFKSLAAAYRHLPETGTAETNIIELLSDYTLEDAFLENAEQRKNSTLRGQGGTKLVTSQPSLYLSGDLTLEQLQLSMSAQDASLSCCGSNLILSTGAVFQAQEAQNLSLVLGNDGRYHPSYGGRGTSSDNPATAILDSQDISLTQIICTGKNGAGESSHPYSHLVVNNGAIGQIVAGSVFHSGISETNADIEIHGGTINEIIGGTLPYGGSGILRGTVGIRVTGGSIGSLYGASSGEINSSLCETEGDIRLNISGGAVERVYSSGMTGRVRGNVDVTISGGAIGTFYGGGVGASDKTEVYGTRSGNVDGDITITITGGTFDHGFYAGGTGTNSSANSGRVEGNVTTTISGNAVINGDVYGGGCGPENSRHADESDSAGILEQGSNTDEADESKASSSLNDNVSGIGNVTGNTTLTIRGGRIMGSVYGGGHASSTEGTSAVYLYGGTISGGVYGGASGGGHVGSSEAVIHVPVGTAESPVNVYGGGATGSRVLGESTLTIGDGARIYGDVYGGGQSQTGESSLHIQGGLIEGNAYGGGNHSDTAGNVTVTQSGGSITGHLYGGANQASVHGNIELHQTAGAVNGSLYGGSATSGTVKGQVSIDVSGSSASVFGGGSGQQTAVENGTRININPGARIAMDVYGGGEDRSVTSGGTSINLSGTAPSGSVFGGGKHADVTGPVSIQSMEGSAVPAIFGGALHSGTVTSPVITIAGAVTNVYGGGYGLGTSTASPVITAAPTGRIAGQITGGAIQGNVRDGVTITLSTGSVTNTVYGGSQEADVTGPVVITAENGSKVENLYGGSNISGEVSAPAITIRGEAGNVYGGGHGSHTKTASPSITLETGAFAKNVYGGGEEGSTTGVNTVLLKGGTAEMVFGGGLSASSQSAVVTLEVDASATHLYGGARESGEISGTATVTVNGTCTNVFGGGLGKQTTVGSSSVTAGGRLNRVEQQNKIEQKDINSQNGADNRNDTGSQNNAVNQNDAANQNNTGNRTSTARRIYGGGDSGTVTGTATVIVSGPITGTIYGGGKGSDSLIGGNTSVTLMKEVTGEIYGGGDMGPVAGSTKVTAMSGSSVEGTIYGGGLRMGAGGTATIELQKDAQLTGTVYGGSNESGEIKQGTEIKILGTVRKSQNAAASTPDDSDTSGGSTGNSNSGKANSSGSSGSIYGDGSGSIYGGGRGIRTIVTDTARLNISGTVDGDVYGGGSQGTISGDARIEIADGRVTGTISGGGQSGNVTGSRGIHITGSNMNGEASLRSIQNAETLTLDNCQLELTGNSNTGDTSSQEYDDTDAQDRYTLSRIGSLILQGGSTLKLQSPVYLLGGIESQNADGSLTTAVSTVNNAIYLRHGTYMELKAGTRNTGTDYGPVHGYALLGAYGPTEDTARTTSAAAISTTSTGGTAVSTASIGGTTASTASTGGTTASMAGNGTTARTIGIAPSPASIYVLGAWNDGETGGFLYADDIYDSRQALLHEKDTVILPTGRKDVWSSWSIGGDRTETTADLIMSNRPGTGKTAELLTSASETETIYRLIPDSLKLESAGETFTLVRPEDLDQARDPSHTLSLTLSTGIAATEDMENLACITGTTADGTGAFIPASTSSPAVIETRTLGGQSDLSFQITLENKSGVNISDREGEYPLQVTFDMAVYQPLSDGSRIQNGQVTVTLRIRRENIRQYSDCLVSPGKQYRNARYLYNMEAENATAAVNVSRGSSITLQYTSDGGAIRETSQITDHHLSFSTYAGISEEGYQWNPEILPAGITILAIDRSSGQPIYYHYTTDGAESTIPLSAFLKNGSGEHYSCRIPEGTAENLLFIIDFAAQNTYSASRLCAQLAPVYEDGTEGAPGQVVFGVGGDNQTYGLSAMTARSRSAGVPTYMEDDTITIPVMTVITGGSGTDTAGEGRQMAVRIRLKNRDTDTYVKIPSTWVAQNGSGDYISAKNGVLTVPLSSSLTACNCQVNLKLDKSAIPAGAYRLELKLAQGVMAQYAAEVDNVLITHDFNLEKYQYSVNAVLSGGNNRRLVPADENRKPLTFTMQYATSGNPDTGRLTLVTELQRKTDGSFQSIDWSTLFKNVSGLTDKHSWGTNTLTYQFRKESLEPGSYRIRFTVVDGNGNVVNESAESFLILPS